MTQLSQFIINGLVVGGIYALVAVGLSLVYGGLRIPNFAHGVWVMVAAYLTVTVIGQWQINLWLAILIILGIMGVVGAVQELAWFRIIRGKSTLVLILAAFALSLVVENIYVLRFGGKFSRSFDFPIKGGFTVGGVVISYQRLTVVLVTVASIAVLSVFMSRTRMGRAIRAVAENADAAAVTGISVSRVYLWVFGVSTAMAGIAGLLLAGMYPVQPFLGANEILKAFCIIIVAGKNNVSGLVAVAFGLGVAESVAMGYLPWTSVGEAIAFAGLAVALYIRPQGLVADPGAPA